MFSLDVADAYLCVEQPAEMWVSLYGDQYQLLRLLPGQREGSARWYDMFSAALAEAGATAWPACPALFRFKDGQGAGLTHVDDLITWRRDLGRVAEASGLLAIKVFV